MSETHLQQGGVVTRDILTDIDALIDSQLAAGEPEGGYDYDDPGYPRCWHCSEPWHGLAITVRMRAMRWVGAGSIYHLELEHDGRAMWSSILYPDAEGAYRHANAALGLGAAFRLTECPPAETGDWALETGNGMTITTTTVRYCLDPKLIPVPKELPDA